MKNRSIQAITSPIRQQTVLLSNLQVVEQKSLIGKKRGGNIHTIGQLINNLMSRGNLLE